MRSEPTITVPQPIDRGWILRRLTDWQLQLPFDLAHALSLDPDHMERLVTMVDRLVWCAERDAARAAAVRAVAYFGVDISAKDQEGLARAARGFKEEA